MGFEKKLEPKNNVFTTKKNKIQKNKKRKT